MRQVNRDELIFNVTLAMRNASATLRKGFASNDGEVRRWNESILAAIIVDKALAPYEIMINAPEGPPCPVISEGSGGRGIGGTSG